MARKTIEQRIALQGGQEIIAQLRQMGDAGEKAFQQIRDAAERAGTPGAQLGRAIGTLKKSFRDLGTSAQRVRTQFLAVGGSLNNVAASFRSVALRTVALSAAVVGSVVGLVRFTQASTAAADAAGKTAAALGLTVEEFGRLQFAAEQSGVDDTQFEAAITRLNTLLFEAASGTEAAIEQFSRLGVSFRDSAGNIRATEDVLGDIGEVFASLPDGAEKSAIAVELFGRRAGPALVNLLNSGRAGIRALGDEAERLGLVFTKEQTVIAAAFNDSLEALGRTVSGLRNQIGLLLAPALTAGSNALIEIINDNRAAIQDFAANVVERATPIVEDFLALLTGRDGDVQNQFLIDARDAIVAFGEATREAVFGIVIPAYNALIAAAQAAAFAVNGIFGTSISGEQLLIAAAILQFTGALRLLIAVAGLAINSVRLLVASFALLPQIITIATAAFGVLKAGVLVAVAAFAGLLSIPGAVVTAVALAIAAVIIFWDEIVAAATVAIDAIVGTLGRIASGAVAAFQALVAAAAEAWQRVRAIVGDGLSAIWQRMRAAGVGVWDAFRSAAEGAISFVSRQLDRLRSAIDRIRAALARLRASSRESGSGSSSEASAFASGGRVRGPGTGTSDSIPAWLSDGEWVIKAKAVRHYGHGVLSAINAMRLPRQVFGGRDEDERRLAAGGAVRRSRKAPAFATGGPVDARRISIAAAQAVPRFSLALPQFPAFATGGPVIVSDLMRGFGAAMTVPMPRFAAGGEVAMARSGRPVMLNIGGQEFGPMQADDDVVEQLARFATRRQVASLGRRPGWYGK